MYKVTLWDMNIPSCCSGTISVYVDDINDFQNNWTKLERDEGARERFQRSLGGELVTDYYGTDHDEDLNIVQKDDNAVVFAEGSIEMNDKWFEILNGYNWPVKIHVDNADIGIRFVKYGNKFMKLGKFSLKGVCMDFGGYRELTICGNPFFNYEQLAEYNRYVENKIEDFSNDSYESFVWYELAEYDSLEDIMAEELLITDDEFQLLFADLAGEAG